MKRPCSLESSHITRLFDCGNEDLNRYLDSFAMQNQKKDASKTYVVLDGEGENPLVIAYYTLVFGAIDFKNPPKKITRGLSPYYPVPIILLARLAVDKDYQGRQIGQSLVQDACLRAVQASEIAGLRAVVVDAKDANAKNFYIKCGFEPSGIEQFQLFSRIADIKGALSASNEADAGPIASQQ